ncbi:MAG TPA: formate dehydrogenase accessory sulfurtransferase FdhD [Nitrospirota bacterium]|nr:formate dehydrogenase accessory sulfurtransferase FdhD [Nitrospirota bacterium]
MFVPLYPVPVLPDPYPLPPSPALCYIPFVETKRDTPVLKVTGNAVEGIIDEVASELPIRLVLNGEALVTLLCTPAELEELAVGFLLSEGLLRDRSAIKKLDVDEQETTVRIELSGLPADFSKLFEKRTVSSGCGKGVTFTQYRMYADERIVVKGPLMTLDDIRRLLKTFRNISALYLETGGVHSAALSDGKEILFFSEDIGRHNAVDKLIGRAFLKSVSVENKILLTSGRVTSEIMTKAGRNRFPILISRAAPSCMAISYAEDMGITLIGFARGDRMNIYSWPKRIKFD